MDELEISKIFGAGCAALLAFVGFGQLGSAVVSVEQLDEPAFIVEIDEEEGADDVEVVERMPIGQLMAMANIDDGAKVFRKCSACHKVEEGAANGVGPALYGIVGRDIGSVDGYSYSNVLAEMDGQWDFAALDGFLEAPKVWAPGTKMGFAGLSKAEDRASVIAWLNEKSASPLPMPAADAGADEQAAVIEEDAPAAEVAEAEQETVETEVKVVESAEEDVETMKVEMPSEEAQVAGAEVAEEKAIEEETAETKVVETEAKDEVAEVAKVEEPKEAEVAAAAVEEPKEVEVAAAEVEPEKAPAKPAASEPAAAAAAAPAAAAATGLMALADLDKGKKVFRKCRACHKVEAGKNGVGPHLWGVVGRDIGAVDGFKYSDALKGKGGKWDVESLDGFLLKPKEWAPGTKMAFGGLRKDVDRASVIAWLNEQSDAPLPLE